MSIIFTCVFTVVAAVALFYVLFFVLDIFSVFPDDQNDNKKAVAKNNKKKSPNAMIGQNTPRYYDNLNSPRVMVNTNQVAANPARNDLNDFLATGDTNEFITMSDSSALTTGISSIIGTRKYQQDSVIAMNKATIEKYNNRLCIAILCDGMGGMEGGEIASAMSARKLYEDFIKIMPENIPQFLHDEIIQINDMVSNLKDKDDNTIDSGSTLVAAIVKDNQLYKASVGDSRIYIIRNNTISKITEDQNYLSVLKTHVQKGLISLEDAKSNPQADALISYVGIGENILIDVSTNPINLQNGDIVLLCSDGLYKTLKEDQILNVVLNSTGEADAMAKDLTDLVNMIGKKHQDNTSVAIIQYKNNI